VRFEIWDVARNGAFTQPTWLRPPANPAIVPGAVTGFTLIDADADAPVPGYDSIPPNAVLDRARLPAHLNVRANTSPLVVEQVTLALDGASTTRTVWPYCLAQCEVKPGLRGCPFYDYGPAQLEPGSHVLTATASRGAISGSPLTLRFSVTNSARVISKEPH